MTLRVHARAYGRTARAAARGVDADENGRSQVPYLRGVVRGCEKRIDARNLERVVVVRLHHARVLPKVQLLVGRHDPLDELRPFLVPLPVGDLVLHVHALEKIRATARLAHKRDAYGVEHGVPVFVFQAHQRGIVARLFLRRGSRSTNTGPDPISGERGRGTRELRPAAIVAAE